MNSISFFEPQNCFFHQTLPCRCCCCFGTRGAAIPPHAAPFTSWMNRIGAVEFQRMKRFEPRNCFLQLLLLLRRKARRSNGAQAASLASGRGKKVILWSSNVDARAVRVVSRIHIQVSAWKAPQVAAAMTCSKCHTR